jgi:phospholipid/cholesterol/gamma-HCH transport system substrate-binding protein
MKFKKQVAIEVMVGVFAFAIIAVLLALTTILSEEMLFKKYARMDVVFDSVSGLRVGDEVNARGVTVGKVKTITLAPDGVHVGVRLDIPITLRDDYLIEVLSGSVLGGRYLSVFEGTADAPEISLDDPLKGSPSAELMDTATQAVEEIRDALQDGILEDLKASMAQIRKITTDLGEGGGTINRLLEDDELYSEIQRIAVNIRVISDDIANGEGTIGKLVKDDQVYQDLQDVVANLQSITDGLAKGEGTMGRLLSEDDQMYVDLAATIAAIRGVSEATARGEGTIGKLFADEALYLEIEALLREGRAAVDDLRETSPITTFTSIFFGAF